MTHRPNPRADRLKRKCPLLSELKTSRGVKALISELTAREMANTPGECAVPCDGFRSPTQKDKAKCRNILIQLKDQWDSRNSGGVEVYTPSTRGRSGKNGGAHEFLAIIGSSHSVAEAVSLLLQALEEGSEDDCENEGGKRKVTPKPLTKALQYASHHFTDPRLSARQVAAASGVSQQRMAKLFREFLGITFTEWLAQCRIAKAQQYLRTSEQKILDIALACGFGAISSFNRVFRQQVGMTPSDFRSACQPQGRN